MISCQLKNLFIGSYCTGSSSFHSKFGFNEFGEFCSRWTLLWRCGERLSFIFTRLGLRVQPTWAEDKECWVLKPSLCCLGQHNIASELHVTKTTIQRKDKIRLSYIRHPGAVLFLHHPLCHIFAQICFVSDESQHRSFFHAFLQVPKWLWKITQLLKDTCATSGSSYQICQANKHVVKPFVTWTLPIHSRTLVNDCSEFTSYMTRTPSALRKYCFVMLRNLKDQMDIRAVLGNNTTAVNKYASSA